MAENFKSSLLAIVKETTSGTPKDVSRGSEYAPMEPDVEFVPNIDSIQSEEIRASIAPSASIPGLEHPSATFNLYLKHSGVEGQAPAYGSLLESAFGSTSTNSTQRTTTTGSTTTVINLAAGGTDFARGKAVLIKDSTYSIRAIDSVSTNALTLGFALSTTAPGAGVNTGKCVNYAPANSGHPTVTAHLYRANGGDHEVIAGANTSLSMDVNVGELINMGYSLQGSSFYFNPIRVTTGSNDKLDFTDDDGTFAATIAAGFYKTPHDLASAVTAAMNSANSGETHTCIFNSLGTNKGKFKISSTGTVLSLPWQSGTNTATSIKTSLGYANTDDTGTAATTGYLSDVVQSYAATVSATFDANDPMVAKNMEFLVGDQTTFESACVISMTLNLDNTITEVPCISAVSGLDSTFVSARVASLQVTAVYDRHDADKFDRFFNATDVKAQFNFGVKSGGNWVPGKSGCLYIPTAKISAVQMATGDGDIVTQEYTIAPYADANGNGEIYLNFL